MNRNSHSEHRGNKAGEDRHRRELLGVALRVLNALCVEQRQPEQTDEAYLREAVGDKSTSLDELACEIIQSGLRKPARRVPGKNKL
jgi:hypothetical protein